MEVGAVKQAFNNEVIQLRNNLNQAKIQVIHKLTRKAKTLAEKKAPDHLKEKFKKKAESAVQEVLIMKKLKPRDIARFIITHTGELNSHLNKPAVDNNKACARLLLHKSLQQKYKSIKENFANIPIKDLLMSRQERRKLKKEAKEQQMNRKKGNKAKVVNSEGDWNVEDVEMGDDSKVSQDHESDVSNQDDISNDGSQDIDDEDIAIEHRLVVGDSSEEESGPENDDLVTKDSDDENGVDNQNAETDDNDEGQDSDISIKATESGKFVKPAKETKLATKMPIFLVPNDSEPKITPKLGPRPPKQKKNPDKKVNEKKNKNLKEKLLNRNFKKDTDDSQTEKKVVDPFFITATGENYMSLAEPRQPDEVKDIHSQGNRKLRRAAMFGHVSNIKPRRDNFSQNNYRSGKFESRNDKGMDSNGRFNKFDGNDRRSKFNDRASHFNDKNFNNERNSKFHDRNSKFNDRSTNVNDRNHNLNNQSSKNSYDRTSKFSNNFNNSVSEAKEEKLHPSWEAKKKQSGILPFKGKKIVFDEN